VGDGFLGFFAGPGKADRALNAARQAKQLFEVPDLVVVLHAGEIFLGSVGHPDYARTDIIGQTVNTAFLAMPFVAAQCAGGIGITRAVVDELTGDAAALERGLVTVSGERDALTVYEPRRTS
jgi:hypothetical protein